MAYMTRHKNDQMHSKTVGKVVGPVLSLLFLSELVTLHIYSTPASPHVVYLNGFVLLVLGACLVALHNVWVARWPVLITLSAWALVALGLYRLFLPDAPQAPVGTSTYVAIGAMLVVELVVTIKSYTK